MKIEYKMPDYNIVKKAIIKSQEEWLRAIETEGMNYLNNQLSFSKKDGNYDVNIKAKIENNILKITMYGTQAIYLEFGSGLKALNNPHPKSKKAGYKYSNRKKWSYFHKVANTIRWSHGNLPQRPLLNTAEYLRIIVGDLYKTILIKNLKSVDNG